MRGSLSFISGLMVLTGSLAQADDSLQLRMGACQPSEKIAKQNLDRLCEAQIEGTDIDVVVVGRKSKIYSYIILERFKDKQGQMDGYGVIPMEGFMEGSREFFPAKLNLDGSFADRDTFFVSAEFQPEMTALNSLYTGDQSGSGVTMVSRGKLAAGGRKYEAIGFHLAGERSSFIQIVAKAISVESSPNIETMPDYSETLTVLNHSQITLMGGALRREPTETGVELILDTSVRPESLLLRATSAYTQRGSYQNRTNMLFGTLHGDKNLRFEVDYLKK